MPTTPSVAIEKLLVLKPPPRRIVATSDAVVYLRHAAKGGEHHRNRCLGDRIGITARHIGNDDTAGGCGWNIDVIDSGAVFCDYPEAWACIHERCVHPDVPHNNGIGVCEGPPALPVVLGKRSIYGKVPAEPRKAIAVDRMRNEHTRRAHVQLASPVARSPTGNRRAIGGS